MQTLAFMVKKTQLLWRPQYNSWRSSRFITLCLIARGSSGVTQNIKIGLTNSLFLFQSAFDFRTTFVNTLEFSKTARKKCIQQKVLRISLRSFLAMMKVCCMKNILFLLLHSNIRMVVFLANFCESLREIYIFCQLWDFLIYKF